MAIRYYSTSGSDVTGDGTEGNPWASVAKFIAVHVSGDTHRFKAGQTFTVTTTTVITSPCTLERWGRGDNPIFDGANAPSVVAVLKILDAPNVLVDGIDVTRGYQHGIQVVGSGATLGLNNLFVGVRSYANGLAHPTPFTSTADGFVVTVSSGTATVTFRHCWADGNGNDGFAIYGNGGSVAKLVAYRSISENHYSPGGLAYQDGFTSHGSGFIDIDECRARNNWDGVHCINTVNANSVSYCHIVGNHCDGVKMDITTNVSASMTIEYTLIVLNDDLTASGYVGYPNACVNCRSGHVFNISHCALVVRTLNVATPAACIVRVSDGAMSLGDTAFWRNPDGNTRLILTQTPGAMSSAFNAYVKEHQSGGYYDVTFGVVTFEDLQLLGLEFSSINPDSTLGWLDDPANTDPTTSLAGSIYLVYPRPESPLPGNGGSGAGATDLTLQTMLVDTIGPVGYIRHYPRPFEYAL